MLRRILLGIWLLSPTSAFAGSPDEDWKQRYEAFVVSLNHRQLAEDYPGAVRNLDSPDPKQQIVGIKTLAATDDIRAIPWIVPLLDSEDHRVRIDAGQALNAVVASHELKRRGGEQGPSGPWFLERADRFPCRAGIHRW